MPAQAVSLARKRGCVFCDIVAGDAPVPRRFRRVNFQVVAFEPLNPVVPGHLLVVPRGHVEDAAESPVAAGICMSAAALLVRDAGGSANIITSVGEAATQSVFHLHLHVVPRVAGDGIALPWTGQP